MKYQNAKALKYFQKESELRRLETRNADLWKLGRGNYKTVEPYQDGWDIYFNVIPYYQGTVYEAKIYEALTYCMYVGFRSMNDEHICKHRKFNELGYRYTGTDIPEICGISEEDYESLKISKDLFTKTPRYDWQHVSEEYGMTYDYTPIFGDAIIPGYESPSIVDKEFVIDFLALQEEAENDARILSKHYKHWGAGRYNTKWWRTENRRSIRRKDKNQCRAILLGNDSFESDFYKERSDMWWNIT
jgi:hypothetical protein